MPLKINILPEIKKNTKLVYALTELHKRSFYTIQFWIKNNDPLLSTSDSLQLISAYLHLPLEELIEKLEVKTT